MASDVIVKEATMVYPASETPNHTITLPSLDTVLRLPYAHTLNLYIYPPKTHPSKNLTINVLQSSLSNILVPYYPLAGRLTRNPKNNHLEITCNAMGVLFVEAETITHALDHFGEFTPSHAHREVAFPPPFDYTKGISMFPLLAVQVTRFRCGGVTLGLMVHHSVQDGFAVAQFVNSWSRLVRGLDLEVWPCHDRIKYLGPRQRPQVKFRHFEYEPPVGLPAIVQEAITRMDDEYLRSAIDYLAVNPGLTCLNPSLTWIQQERNPNLSINSWVGIPFEEADFGLGGPTWVRLGGVGYEGQTVIMPSTNGDGSLSVSINLSMAHMNIFKNYIYDFIEILPSL